jgi:DNA repair protein RecN (Recombination protein N)
MIERFFLKGNFLFKEEEIIFDKGLIVFSGASGSGKSVLLDSILSTFALKNVDNALSEVSLADSNGDLLVFKQQKITSKNRYFINNESINKKDLFKKANDFIHFLSVKDNHEFSNDALLFLLDLSISAKSKTFNALKEKYQLSFSDYEKLTLQLATIEKKEQEIIEKKEFIIFEIQRIKNCNPKENEYDELLALKRKLSKKEKIENAINQASDIFNYEAVVQTALNHIGATNDFFDDTINELKTIFDNELDELKKLEHLNSEEILDRLQDISDLINKYGSIKEALKYKEDKSKQLEEFENITYNKKEIKDKLDKLKTSLLKIANDISKIRNKSINALTKNFNKQNSILHLGDVFISLQNNQTIYKNGIDKIDMKLEKSSLLTISSGETNRLRLSILALKNSFEAFNGIIILDEIDANLSGVESEGVAKVLHFLSKSYQIICISHHPQLASYANLHFLISRKKDKSTIKLMNEKESFYELAILIRVDYIREKSLKFS